MRVQTNAWADHHASIFARATICNVALLPNYGTSCRHSSVRKLTFGYFIGCFLMSVVFWTHTAQQHVSAVKRWGPEIRDLPNLFVKQLVSRFLFLRDHCDPFKRTLIQIGLSCALPNFIASTKVVPRNAVSEFLPEVVSSYRFLNARFTFEYLSKVMGKRLYCDIIEPLCPEQMYRSLYHGGRANNVRHIYDALDGMMYNGKHMWYTGH